MNMHCDVEFSDNHLYSSVSITAQNNSVLSESSLLIINPSFIQLLIAFVFRLIDFFNLFV